MRSNIHYLCLVCWLVLLCFIYSHVVIQQTAEPHLTGTYPFRPNPQLLTKQEYNNKIRMGMWLLLWLA